MPLPAYFLRQPAADWSAATTAAFDRLLADALRRPGAWMDYTLPAPKWQLLCHACDRHDIVLHGSGEPDIVEFEPRQSDDLEAFGNRRAVYAAADGIWPIYFAIVDRPRYVRSLVNACFTAAGAGGAEAVDPGPYYYFSINADALPHAPWRRGTVYLLPGGAFERQPPKRAGGLEITIPQRASLAPVRPLAKLAVGPEDFPFLAEVRGHDPSTLRARAQADPDGFPWHDEPR